MQKENDTEYCTVSAEQAGLRLDAFLTECLPDQSRSALKRVITQGHVAHSTQTIPLQKPYAPSTQVKEDEQWQVRMPPVIESALVPEDIPLDIAFEDEHMLVINKAAGMTVHPAPGHYTGTLVHALLHHCGESLSGIGGEARPGIVHRLDKDTSGLMVVAKHDEAHRNLSEQLAERTLKRQYCAITWGVPEPAQGLIDTPMARHPSMRKKMAVVNGGKPARTHYRSVQTFEAPLSDGTPVPFATHIECALDTGRTHQIRVHLHHLGHGLIGDPVYGTPTPQRLARARCALPQATEQAIRGFARQALHAQKIAFTHPVTGEAMQFASALPEDMVLLLHALKDLQNLQ